MKCLIGQRIRPIAIVVLLLALVGVVYWVVIYLNQTETRQNSTTVSQKHLRYQFELHNRGEAVADQVDITLFIPDDSLPFQRRIGTKAGNLAQLSSGEYTEDGFRLRLKRIAPYARKSIILDAQVEITSGMHIVEPGQWLAAQRYIEADHPLVRRVAQQFSSLSKHLQPKAVYSWVVENIQSLNYIRESRGAVWVLENRKGDCTEFSYLYVALLRHLGIPAMPVGGFIARQPSTVLGGADYHNWAYFHQDGEWKLADPQNGVFDQSAENYVVFRVIRDPEDERAKFFTSHPDVLVFMR
ncbi:MAG: hypothetical protein CSB48_09265 [Proteobacteria bacterium]|nr:MAG: hypothetical protein CSB48_09265 [Pseudomonadota bacterium]